MPTLIEVYQQSYNMADLLVEHEASAFERLSDVSRIASEDPHFSRPAFQRVRKPHPSGSDPPYKKQTSSSQRILVVSIKLRVSMCIHIVMYNGALRAYRPDRNKA